jgi:uncharacterized protein YdhG (YjbR/CyaY superfamily)
MKATHEATGATNVDATAQIDAYLATLPDDTRHALEALRRTIQAAAPQAVEAISYGAPAFRYHGHPLVSYRAAKSHCSFFPMNPAVIESHRDALKSFDTAKGTIRFTPDAPLPESLVTSIVKARVAEADARTAG